MALLTMRILLVDNDPVYLNLLSEVLTLYSHQVFTAPGGEAALEFLKKQPVDLLISDASMPEMNGLELLDKIRQEEDLQDLPFAWNSAYGDLLEVLHLRNPAIDFKFNKAQPVGDLLYLVHHLNTALELRDQRTGIVSRGRSPA
jgi:CheY-like chemotaxis protein